MIDAKAISAIWEIRLWEGDTKIADIHQKVFLNSVIHALANTFELAGNSDELYFTIEVKILKWIVTEFGDGDGNVHLAKKRKIVQ